MKVKNSYRIVCLKNKPDHKFQTLHSLQENIVSDRLPFRLKDKPVPNLVFLSARLQGNQGDKDSPVR